MKFKEGDIVVVISFIGRNPRKVFPIGLITQIYRCHHGLTATPLKKDYYTYAYATNNFLKFRKATKREEFLYHLEGGPFVLKEENDAI